MTVSGKDKKKRVRSGVSTPTKGEPAVKRRNTQPITQPIVNSDSLPKSPDQSRSKSPEILDTIIVEAEGIVRTLQYPTCPLLNVVVMPSKHKHVVNIAGCSSIKDLQAEVKDNLPCHEASRARYFAMTLNREYKNLEEVDMADIMTVVVVCK